MLVWSGPATPEAAKPEAPHVAEVSVPNDLPAFVVRGSRRAEDGGQAMVFMSGLCSRPGDYLATYPWAAAVHGDSVGVQGDHSCGGDGAFRSWGSDLEKIERRMDAAYQAAGLEVPREITLLGYSQGAERAERLAANHPERFTRLVLMSSPVMASRDRVGKAKAVAIGVGEREDRTTTLEAFRNLKAAKVPVAWFLLPEARHGEMGPDAQRVMADVLAWIEAPTAEGTPIVHTTAPQAKAPKR